MPIQYILYVLSLYYLSEFGELSISFLYSIGIRHIPKKRAITGVSILIHLKDLHLPHITQTWPFHAQVPLGIRGYLAIW